MSVGIERRMGDSQRLGSRIPTEYEASGYWMSVMPERTEGVSASPELPTAVHSGRRYAIKEVFGTLQGEGAQAGCPAVFLRFAGCNLGYEICPWCDTDWVRPEYREDVAGTLALVERAKRETFSGAPEELLLVATGGEPSLQFDRDLSDALRQKGYRIAMESNGSRPVDRSLVDWLTVSPKQAEYVQREGEELKVLFTGGIAAGPATDVNAVRRMAAATDFRHYFLQAIDLPGRGPNYDATIRAVMELGPPWRLSVQTHKITGIR